MSGILGALLVKPLKGFKGLVTGWKAAGSAKGLGIVLSDIGKSTVQAPGKAGEKAAEYMSKTFEKGIGRGVGKMIIDAPIGVESIATNLIGSTIRHSIGIPLTAIGATSRLGARLLHGIGEAGGYDLAKAGAKAAGRGAWWMTKTGAKGAALEGLKAGNLAVMMGKGIWKMRNNAAFQRAAFWSILGGSTAYGAMRGERQVFAGQMLPYDDFQSTFTNPQPIHNPENAQVPGQRGWKHAIDDFGADGNLVFAMNNLRKTGMF